MVYETPGLCAEWQTDWTLVSIHGKPDATNAPTVSLEPAVQMAALAAGLQKSMPFLPLSEELT
jgi:hypothetical protein